MSAIISDLYAVRPHKGWHGVFTTEEFDGAIPNGTRVVKCMWEPKDGHPMGAKARVLGSIGHPEVGIGYFVEFEEHPRVAVFIQAVKIRPMVQQ